MAFAEFKENFAEFKIFVAIPLEQVDHPQSTQGGKIGHGFPISALGHDLLAIVNALVQQFQFSAAPGKIGVGQANGGIVPGLFTQFKGLEGKFVRFLSALPVQNKVMQSQP